MVRAQETSSINTLEELLLFMTFVLEREFERKGGLRAHGTPYDQKGRPRRHIKSGGKVILHRLSEDILTSNVFGVLEKLEPRVWLKSLLAECFEPDRFPEVFNDENYRRDGIRFLFWHELGRPKRPKGHEEGPTQVDLFIEMPKSTISIEVKFQAELSPSITTDLAVPKRNRSGVPDSSLWWDQVIRNLERGYVHTIDNYPGRLFFFIVLSMEKESSSTPFLSRYKNHPEQIRRQIESKYRWENPKEMRYYFNDKTYNQLSHQLAWLTWTEVSDILSQTQFQNAGEELFRQEIVEYIDRKIQIHKEMGKTSRAMSQRRQSLG